MLPSHEGSDFQSPWGDHKHEGVSLHIGTHLPLKMPQVHFATGWQDSVPGKPSWPSMAPSEQNPITPAPAFRPEPRRSDHDLAATSWRTPHG